MKNSLAIFKLVSLLTSILLLSGAAALPSAPIRELQNAASANSWSNIANAPAARSDHAVVWTGSGAGNSEMIVWGGHYDDTYDHVLNSGARYNPATNTWTTISSVNAPQARSYPVAVWTGNGAGNGEMIVWGGGYNTGGRYNPSTDTWTATSTTNAPTAVWGNAIWTGSGGAPNGEMIVWEGGGTTGGRYNPTTNTWTAISTLNAPATSGYYTLVWTGSEMIAWDGSNQAGGRYNPTSNTWTAMATANAPASRSRFKAVWSGSAMIVWGGSGSSGELNSGGRYNPLTNTWAATTTVNAPAGRAEFAAAWTGSEMIVWGGYYIDSLDNWHLLNSGGRYNPLTDAWQATSTTNAPVGRDFHSGVWTGNRLIVTGGYDSSGNCLDSGGAYNPYEWMYLPQVRSGH
jgi:N-acetylneuraminic acid mutarotase